MLGRLGKIATNEVAADLMSLRLLVVSSPPKVNNKAASGGCMAWVVWSVAEAPVPLSLTDSSGSWDTTFLLRSPYRGRVM